MAFERPNITKLCLNKQLLHTSYITDELLTHIVITLPLLHTLVLNTNHNRITHNGLDVIKNNCPNLLVLQINNHAHKISETEFCEFMCDMPQLDHCVMKREVLSLKFKIGMVMTVSVVLTGYTLWVLKAYQVM